MKRTGTNRREFLRAATAGTLLAAAWADDLAAADEPRPPAPGKDDELNIAFVGIGTQGRVLLAGNCLKMTDQRLRIRAICDIWEYRRTGAVNLVRKYGHDTRGYEDYREMLASEKDLDAVIIATPDWMHAEIAVACLKAGLHAYCEKEMSNTLEGARSMVRAARQTGKLLQIGHQRRSNPRYLTALEYVRRHRALGRITNTYGQWNRFRGLHLARPAPAAMPNGAAIARHGYPSVEHLLNWRWYKRYSGGPIADLGSHQVDVFNWFLDAAPRAISAMSCRDAAQPSEWYTSVNAMYEWATAQGRREQVVQGFYQLLNTSSHGGYFETFIGDEGSMNMREFDGRMGLRREEQVDIAQFERELDAWGRANIEGYRSPLERIHQPIKVGYSPPHTGRIFTLPFDPRDDRPVHWAHLANFFSAVRNPQNVKLNCPADEGYHSAVSVLRVNDCLAAGGGRLEIRPEEYVVS